MDKEQRILEKKIQFRIHKVMSFQSDTYEKWLSSLPKVTINNEQNTKHKPVVVWKTNPHRRAS